MGFARPDASASGRVDAVCSETLVGRLFDDFDCASSFFQAGAVGLSPGRRPGTLEAVELGTDCWRVEPLDVLGARSSFFDDQRRFPRGSIELDCGLLMRDTPCTWSAVPAAVARAGRSDDLPVVGFRPRISL